MTTSLQRFFEMSGADASNNIERPSPYTVSDACPGCGCIVYGLHYCPGRTPMPQPQDPLTGSLPITIPGVGETRPSLRRAASEALLAGALALSDISRAVPDCRNGWTDAMKATEERFRKALEQLAEALA